MAKKKSKQNVQRHKIIRRMQRELEEQVSCDYAFPEKDTVQLEILKEIIIIIFLRILKMNILSYDTIYYIYLQIMKLDKKYRVYQLLKIYLHLQMQKLFYDGIISKHQLESIYPKTGNNIFCFEDGAYLVKFGYEFYNYNPDEEPIDEITFWSLCAVADNIEISERTAYAWYEEITSLDKDTLIDEINNLIVRFKIRELRENGIITEYDETMFMSKIQERELTYAYFSKEEIERWKSKAIHSIKEFKNKTLNRRELWNV